jgi:hypothetical protein
MRSWLKGIALVLTLGLTSQAAYAQSGAGIAGVVKDASGAVIPGVTVEAASPALIEKTRVVVTDQAGQYKIVDLRPGTYAVTFTLAGFNGIVREGIELSAGFTAPVNVEMRVGALSETITVAGQTPIIDIQGVQKQQVIVRDVIDAVPTAKNWQTIGTMVVGVVMSTPDVGGSSGEQQASLSAHGSPGGDVNYQLGGISVYNMHGTSSSALSMNDAAAEEVSYQIGAISADMPTGGVVVNVIPKEGGNRFSGMLFGNYSGKGWQSDNFDDSLRQRGLVRADRNDKFADQSASLGGPIKRDKLWFFFSERYWGRGIIKPDIYYSKDASYKVPYNPDLSRPGNSDEWEGDEQIRLTWQVTPKNKVGFYVNDHQRCICHLAFVTGISSANAAAEATVKQITPWLYNGQVTLSSTITSKVLLQAGSNYYNAEYQHLPDDASLPGAYPVTDQFTGRRTGIATTAPGTATGFNKSPQWVSTSNASLTYVTGSHAVKVGGNVTLGHRESTITNNHDTWLTVSSATGVFVPVSVTVLTTPFTERTSVPGDLGLYAQDKWTIHRFTMNLGLRFDWHRAQIDAESTPGGTWIGPRSFDPSNACKAPAVTGSYSVTSGPCTDAPNWKDISPRLGISYDVFGNGKTALKATVSRYIQGDTDGFANSLNPLSTTVNATTRSWNRDTNGDLIPQVEELGPLASSTFGTSIVTRGYDDELRYGWFKRPYNWEYSGTVQQQLLARVSAEVAYYHRTFGGLTTTDNLDVAPTDYDSYCVTAPSDARLPAGGGYRLCGLSDIRANKFGVSSNNVITKESNFAKRKQAWDGVDFSTNARLGGNLYLSGGVSVGRQVTNTCAVIVDQPAGQFCDNSPNWLPREKVSGTYTFPWDFQTGFAFQSNPGPQITASYAMPLSLITPELGRPLSGSRTSATVALIEPGTIYGDRWNELDVRVSKKLKIGGPRRLELMADVYNLLNANPVQQLNTTYGADWLKPQAVLLARFVKIGARLSF